MIIKKQGQNIPLPKSVIIGGTHLLRRGVPGLSNIDQPLPVRQVSQHVGVSPQYVHNLISRDQITSYQVEDLNGRVIRGATVAEVQEYREALQSTRDFQFDPERDMNRRLPLPLVSREVNLSPVRLRALAKEGKIPTYPWTGPGQIKYTTTVADVRQYQEDLPERIQELTRKGGLIAGRGRPKEK